MGGDVRGRSGGVAESERRLRKRCTRRAAPKPTQTGVKKGKPNENGVNWGIFGRAGSTGSRAGSTGRVEFVKNSSGSALVSSNSRIFGKIQGNWLNTNEGLVPNHEICGSKSQITSQIERSAPSNLGLYFWYF